MGLKMKVLLAISLGLNLLFLGLVLGRMTSHFRHHPRGERENAWFQQIPPLSPSSQDKLAELQRLRKENRGQIRQLREQLMQIFSEARFDAATYQKVSEEILELQQQTERAFLRTIQEMGQGLDQQQRQALTQWLKAKEGPKRLKNRPRDMNP